MSINSRLCLKAKLPQPLEATACTVNNANMCATKWAKGHKVRKCWTLVNNAIQTCNVELMVSSFPQYLNAFGNVHAQKPRTGKDFISKLTPVTKQITKCIVRNTEKHRAEAKIKYYGKQKYEYWQYAALGIAIKESKTFLFTMFSSLNIGAHEKTCGIERKVLHFDFIRHISGTIWGLEYKKWHDKLSKAWYIHLVPLCFTLNGRFKCHLHWALCYFTCSRKERQANWASECSRLADATQWNLRSIHAQ